MRKFFLLLTLLSTMPLAAVASNCTGKTCIDVTTDPKKGGIVITATQNTPGKAAKPRVQPAPRSSVTPHKAIAKPRPKPQPTSTPTAQLRRYTRPAVHPARKIARAFTPKVVAAVSLSDSLTQLLPLRAVYSQPASGALTQIPILFWTDTSPFFSTAASILGIAVGVNLHPTFEWDFGDGTYLTTSKPGASYPQGGISHTYLRPGRYLVRLAISWAGSWSAGGNNFPVLGDVLVQNYSLDLVVAPGPTHYLK